MITCPRCGRPYSPKWSPHHEAKCEDILKRERSLAKARTKKQDLAKQEDTFDAAHGENAWRRFANWRIQDAHATGDWKTDLKRWLEVKPC